MELLTASRLRARRRCARLHHLSYDLGYRPAVQADELRFGSLTHLGLEARWMALMPEAVRHHLVDVRHAPAGEGPEHYTDTELAILDGLPLEASLLAVKGQSSDPYEQARVDVMLRGYHLKWPEDAERYEVLGVEEQFTAQLINPETGFPSKRFQLAGKLDVIVRELSSGRSLIVEHKTSSEDTSPGSDYWKRLRMEGQISTYFAGMRALGYDPAGCVYDVLGKLALRPSGVPLTDEAGVKIVLDQSGQRVRTKDGKKWRETGDSASGYVLQTRPETPEEYEARLVEALAADPDRYFGRAEVARLEQDELEHASDTWQLAQGLLEEQRRARLLQIEHRDPRLAAPRNPDSCVMYGRACAFFDVCTGAASLDDATRFTRLEQVHQELAVVAAS